MSEENSVTDDNFEEKVLKSDVPVIVDFWAPWCAPCRAIGPMIEELQQKFEGQVKVYKCNVDDNPISPSKYQVSAIPTIIFVKDGQLKEQVVGISTKDKLEELVKSLL